MLDLGCQNNDRNDRTFNLAFKKLLLSSLWRFMNTFRNTKEDGNYQEAVMLIF